jgi:hypothetical protein
MGSGEDSLLRMEFKWLAYLEAVNKVGPLARATRVQ